MTYLNIILTINTIVLSIMTFALCFLAYHDMTMSKPQYVSDDEEDYDNDWYCNRDEDDDCEEYVEADLTPKMIKCSREFGVCNHG